MESEPEARRLVEFESDVFSDHGLTLLVDGTAQSHVDLLDPTRLFFEYARRVGHVLDAAARATAPLRVLHLGGGALTLPRYVEATRPWSPQVVVELDESLLQTVLRRLPLPPGVPVEIKIGDASSVVPDLVADGRRFDVVIIDLYRRLEPPAFVATAGFMGGCLDLLDPAVPGLLVVNVADTAGLARLSDQARAVARARPAAELLVTGDASVISGAEDGNAVLVAGPHGIPSEIAERLRRLGPHPAEVLEGARLDHALWGAC